MTPPTPFTAVVADSSPIVSEGLSALCESIAGCQVLGHSSDGEEAWQLIWHLQPDVAVLDTGLSRLPLTELFRRIREFGLTTKILLVSARGDRKTAVDALRTGAAGFLLKSGTARHLEDALREVL